MSKVMQSLQALIDANSVVQTTIVELRSFDPKIRPRASDVSAALLKAHADTTSYLKGLAQEKNSDLLEVRDSLKVAALRFKSLSDSVINRKTNLRELLTALADILANSKEDTDKLSSIGSYINQAEAMSSDLAKGDLAANRTSKLINEYKSEFEDNVPATVKSVAAIKMPLLVKFGSIKVNPARLSGLGLKVQALSAQDVGMTDIGIAIEDQDILVFRRSNADSFNATAIAEKTKKANATIMTRNLKRKRNKIAKTFDELTEERKTIPKKDLGKRKAVADQLALYTEQMNVLDKQISDLSDMTSTEKSMLGASKRALVKSSDDAVFAYANHLLESINERSETQFSLVTSIFLHKLGEDNDLVAMWIMPKPMYLRILSIDEPKIKQWCWAWGR